MKQAAGGRIFWEKINLNGYKFLRAGARQKEAQAWAVRVKMEENLLQVEVVPIWTGPPADLRPQSCSERVRTE